jgi:hypothetical protein
MGCAGDCEAPISLGALLLFRVPVLPSGAPVEAPAAISRDLIAGRACD